MTSPVGPLTLNAARCLHCGDVISSTDACEFVSCSCRAVCVDGGSSYIRRVWDSSLGTPEEVFENHIECSHSFHPLSSTCLGCGAANPDHDPLEEERLTQQMHSTSLADLAATVARLEAKHPEG